MRLKWLLPGTCAGALLLWLVMGPDGAYESCHKVFDEARMYQVEISETIRAEANSSRVRSTLSSFAGELHLRVQEKTMWTFWDPALYLEGRIVPQKAHVDGQNFHKFKGYDAGFTVELRPDCSLQSVAYDGRQSFAVRQQAQQMMGLLSLSLRTRIHGHAEENLLDQLGLSTFIRTKASASGTQLQRSQVQLMKDSELAASITRIDVLRSDIRFEGQTGMSLPDQVHASERLHFYETVGSHTLDYKLSLRRLSRDHTQRWAEWAKASHPERYTVRKNPGEGFRGRDRSSVYSDIRPAKSELSYKAFLEGFLSELEHDAVGAKQKLIAYLLAHPEALSQLRDQIAAQAFHDFALVHILFAIAKTGTADAQNVLASLILDDSLDDSTRLRVLFALPEVPYAQDNLVEAVRTHAGVLKDPQSTSHDMASTSLLISGVLARHATDVMPSVEQTLVRDIQDVLKHHPDPHVRANAIDALGNYGQIAHADTIEHFTESPHEAERVAAVEALVQIPTERREGLLTRRISEEKSPVVRTATLKSLHATGIEQQASLGPLRQVLVEDRDANHRALAVDVLGGALKKLPEGRTILREHAKQETDPKVLQAVGRYLNAYELADARRKS